MRRSTLAYILYWVGWLFFPPLIFAQEGSKLEASMVVHFKSGKVVLNKTDKAQLKQFFQKYEVNDKSRVFVVGYTDAIGDKTHNYQLSRKRAQAIRRQIIRTFAFNAAVVMALGKGEENPVGDNQKASGRASNRRVEVYLVNTKARAPKIIYDDNYPYLAKINTLIKEAQSLIRQRRLAESMKLLKKARGLGGDHYPEWHAAYGIAAFYADAPEIEVNNHLTRALQLDPYHHMARAYLGRFTARQNVRRGKVTKDMGSAVGSAIHVTSAAEQYEYLRIFNVEPLTHRKLFGSSVERWDCVNHKGTPVVYFFDHSNVYDWAFAKRPVRWPDKKILKNFRIQLSDQKSSPGSDTVKPVIPNASGNIWESKIFN